MAARRSFDIDGRVQFREQTKPPGKTTKTVARGFSVRFYKVVRVMYPSFKLKGFSVRNIKIVGVIYTFLN